MGHETLSDLQDDIRFWTNDSALTITSGTNLRVFNIVYQGMLSPDYSLLGVKIGRRWPERVREDTSLTMVVGTEQYAYPVSPKTIDPVYVEGLDADTSEPYTIAWVPDMNTWSSYDLTGNSRPVYCRLIDVSGSTKLALRPKPSKTDGIRITGLVEVTDLTSGSSETIFRNKNSENALAMLVAAVFKSKRGETGRALELINMAKGLLPLYDRTPTLRSGGFIQPWTGLSESRYGSRRSRGRW